VPKTLNFTLYNLRNIGIGSEISGVKILNFGVGFWDKKLGESDR
jgi:hypothetical protein